ncbi:MAG: hypothetical protein V1914_02845 [archaeon]
MKVTDRRIWVSLVSALIFGLSAVSVLSSRVNINMAFIPSFFGNELALKVFLLLAGILLLYDSFGFHSLSGRMKLSSIIAGFLLASLGAFPLLNQFGMLNFLPFIVEFDLTPSVLAGLLLFYSLYLLWDVYLLIRE